MSFGLNINKGAGKKLVIKEAINLENIISA